MQALRNKNTPTPDAWSRLRDGTIRMSGLVAFQLFGSLLNGQVPAYAANYKFTKSMSFSDFVDANEIELDEGEIS